MFYYLLEPYIIILQYLIKTSVKVRFLRIIHLVQPGVYNNILISVIRGTA